MAMTPEQAVEIILGGRSSLPCEACERKGVLMVHDEISLCSACEETGKRRNPEYDEACDVLGKDRPVFGRWMDTVWDALQIPRNLRNNAKTMEMAKAFSVSSENVISWGTPSTSPPSKPPSKT